MNKIENIIFDFGGVLYDISFEKAAFAFKNLGFNLQKFEDQFLLVFKLLEKGSLSPNEFVMQIQMLSENHISKNDILHAFDQILIGMDPGKVEDLRKLKKIYRLYLLSNTNEIHFRKYSEEIKNNSLTSDFYSLFEIEYYSHKLKIRKPDLSIFNFVLNDSKLDPIGTLFVDDSYENITAAASLGIQTFWIENTDSWNKLKIMLNVKL